MNEDRWPTAALDPIRRARILAAAVPGGFAEVVLDVPYERAWAWLTDLERSVPAFDRRVDRLRITARRPAGDGVAEDISFVATRHGVSLPFTARLEDGWCVMRARGRIFVVVMAAVPDGAGRTRYAQLEAAPLPLGRLLQSHFSRDVQHDLKGIRSLLSPE
jgi:hypothetical protein